MQHTDVMMMNEKMILDGVNKFKHPFLDMLSPMLCSVCICVLLKESLALLSSFMGSSLSCVQHAVPAMLLDFFFQGQTTCSALDKTVMLQGQYRCTVCFVVTYTCSYIEMY